jgi:hypothetical protein
MGESIFLDFRETAKIYIMLEMHFVNDDIPTWLPTSSASRHADVSLRKQSQFTWQCLGGVLKSAGKLSKVKPLGNEWLKPGIKNF